MTRNKKPSPERLPGRHPSERVFVGGNYDFMPTLRAIAQFVEEISSKEKKFHPIIPLDHEIWEKETMDRDIQMLYGCERAIFDLSDLGAQLVEMQAAKAHLKWDNILLVYPLRERSNEPQRGRRTVISFGLSHFGYLNFAELKGIVWRFLVGLPTKKDPTPRLIHDPVLDRAIRQIRVLSAQENAGDALSRVQALLRKPRYKGSLDLLLQKALTAHRNSNPQLCEEALARATQLSNGDNGGKAEVLYFKGLIELMPPKNDPNSAMAHFLGAVRLRPKDARILQLLGYVHWRLGDAKMAIESTRKALRDREISDPIVGIQALSNLGYFLGEQAEKKVQPAQNLQEALELTKYLPAYHKAFSKSNGEWLDTRGWILYLKAKALSEAGDKRGAKEVLREALQLLEKACNIEKNKDITEHLQAARKLKVKLQGGNKGDTTLA